MGCFLVIRLLLMIRRVFYLLYPCRPAKDEFFLREVLHGFCITFCTMLCTNLCTAFCKWFCIGAIFLHTENRPRIGWIITDYLCNHCHRDNPRESVFIRVWFCTIFVQFVSLFLHFSAHSSASRSCFSAQHTSAKFCTVSAIHFCNSFLQTVSAIQ